MLTRASISSGSGCLTWRHSTRARTPGTSMPDIRGIEKTAMIRVRAGISYALTEAMDEGHCGLPTDELVLLAEKLLEVAVELVRTALDLEQTEGTVCLLY